MGSFKELLMLEIPSLIKKTGGKEHVNFHFEINHEINEGTSITYANSLAQTFFFISRMVKAMSVQFGVEQSEIYEELLSFSEFENSKGELDE